VLAAVLPVAVLCSVVAGCTKESTDGDKRGRPAAPVTIEMRPDRSDGFFSFPWPNEIRKAADGTLDLTGLPGTESVDAQAPGSTAPGQSLLPELAAKAAAAVTDFGTNSAIYLRATGQLDHESIPTPSESLEPTAAIQLLDLDTGEPAPVIVEVQGKDRFRPDHLVTVLPYPGHPLRPGTRYGLAVTSALLSKAGEPVRPAGLIDRLDEGWSSDTGVDELVWLVLRKQRDEVRSALSREARRDGLVAFTVFRTQDVAREMDAVAASVRDAPPPKVTFDTRDRCAPDAPLDGTASATYRGSVTLTRFQDGPWPYLREGGTIGVDDSGRAVGQGTTKVPIVVKVPCGDPPPGGWPILTFIDGTGAGADLDGISLWDRSGWVTASIPPLFGLGREPPPDVAALLAAFGLTAPEAQSELLFYNFLNPAAARSNPIQQAADHLALQRAVAALTFDRGRQRAKARVDTDDSLTVISGHSQGAQTLPLVAAADPGIDGVVSSTGSGGQYHTVAHISTQRQGLAVFTGDVDLLDELNPVVQLVQTLLEASDGINFPSRMNYLNISGRGDACVAVETSRHFAGALGLVTISPERLDSFYGDEELDPPTAGNGQVEGNADGATRANVELPGGHFVAYDDTTTATAFLDAVRAGRPPRVTVDEDPPTSNGNCPGHRWDDPPRRYAVGPPTSR
jgi:hypothetical protein